MDAADILIPRRHGVDIERARKAMRPLRWLIEGDPEPSEARWREIGESLLLGDQPMDELLSFMVKEGLPRMRKLFDRAVREGIEALPDAPAPMREFFEQVEQRPSWGDERLLLEGARAVGLAGLTGMNVLRDLGLLAGYRASAINKTLVLTGALEGSAQQRLARTTEWWLAATRPGGMDRGRPGYEGTLQVRLIHALVRRRVSGMPEWNVREDGVPVNQCDMHVTYLAFSVVYLLGSRAMGVPISRKEGHAVMHLWRYISWVMGVTEPWLVDSENAGRTAFYQNLLSQAGPDATSRRLGGALVDEPLARHYPSQSWLRGRWNRAKHLSIARTFLGARGMKDLGLPDRVLPWYPLLTAPTRFAYQGVQRLLPRGRERLSRAGLLEQERYLPVLTGRAHASAST